MMRQLFSSQRGFTLVEILAALVLISIVILAFLPMFTQAAITNQSNGNRLTAVNYASSLKDTIRTDVNNLSLSGIKISSCSTSDYVTIKPAAEEEWNGTKYEAVFSGCQTAEEQALGIYRVRIQASTANTTGPESTGEAYMYVSLKEAG